MDHRPLMTNRALRMHHSPAAALWWDATGQDSASVVIKLIHRLLRHSVDTDTATAATAEAQVLLVILRGGTWRHRGVAVAAAHEIVVAIPTDLEDEIKW